MNLYQTLGASIADSVQALGAAVSGKGELARIARPGSGWAEQFSAVSHDDHRGRQTVDALYRAGTVRL